MNSFFTKNMTAKVISICLAFIMWIIVMREVNPQVTKDFPNIAVELVGRSDLRQQDIVILEEAAPVITVRLKGRRDEINKVARNDIRAVADLRGYPVGIANIPVKISPIGNVEIDFSPSTVQVELENIIREQKDITLVVNGSPKTGYIFGEPVYKPTSVWIEGPQSKVDTVTKVVATLETAGETDDITASLPLRALTTRDVEVEVDIRTAYVDVFLPIDRLKTLRIEPNIEATGAGGYVVTDIQLIPEQLSVRGSDDDLRTVTALQTDRIVLDNLSETLTIEVPLIIPEGVHLLDDTPVQARIVVEKLEEEVFTISKNNVTFINAGEGIAVDKELLADTYEVRIEAPQRVLAAIDERTIRLVVDLEDLTPGQHIVEPEISIPQSTLERVATMEVIPKTIAITVINY